MTEKLTKIQANDVYWEESYGWKADKDQETWHPDRCLHTKEDRDGLIEEGLVWGRKMAIGGDPYIDKNGKIKFKRKLYCIWLPMSDPGFVAVTNKWLIPKS